MNRRKLLAVIVTAVTGAMVAADNTQADVERRIRRRMRRRIRRRIRRRVAIRMVLGRPLWVVPVGMVVGWELVRADRVVVVKETRIVERDGANVEVAVVQDGDGKTEQVDIVREDNADNRRQLKGSVLPDDDKTTPGVDDDIEEAADT
jgi:hypothetical protein